jgi:pyrroloquinoline quinone biosynthesis protein B
MARGEWPSWHVLLCYTNLQTMTIRALLLGNAQDAGLPQAGCDCANCSAAWADPALRRSACALAVLDPAAGQAWLIDATPDLPRQLHYMRKAADGLALAGIFITHAHMGHYAGLLHLGLEAMAVRGLPLYGTPRLLGFLGANGPWRQLIEQGNLCPRDLQPGAWLGLSPALSLQALPVPHRAEWSDTLGFVVRGRQRRLLYLPDIDSWQAWAAPPYNQDVRAAVDAVDVALLDGTFFDDAELPGRDLAAIPHPPARETAARLAGTRADVRFIHLNHTNPLHRAGAERIEIEALGLRVGQPGDMWEI